MNLGKCSRLFGIVICIVLLSFSSHATDLKDQVALPQWSYQAFHPEDKAIIEQVLKSEGNRQLIKVNSLPRDAQLVIDDVDAILYDCGLFSILKESDILERMMLVKQAQVGSLSQLLRKYPDLDQEKLKHLYGLFLHD